MILLLAILFADPSHPLIDEGDRWESATLLGTFDATGPKQQQLLFWRRDSFGKIWPAGEIDWLKVTWHAEHDGYRFTWFDSHEECYRSLKVPRLDYAVVDIDVWRVSWPSAPADMRGFLPNPDRREPE